MRETKSDTGRPKAAESLRGPVVALALVGVLLGAAVLLFLRFAHWAGAHPPAAVLVGLLAIPVLYTLFRAMPRARELRRAARAGMADADREIAETARVDVVPAPPVWDGSTDPDGFEAAVAALCERDGCLDVEVVGGAGDLGADILATAPDGRRVVVQCKQYGASNKVGSQDLQRFGGTCWTVHGAQLAAVVTTGQFTEPAQEYAAACGIRCVDGDALTAWAEGSGPAPWGPAMVEEARTATAATRVLPRPDHRE
ncbi:restriction endonuclease [Streptomyces sp. NPDC048436]|uniref:restriction endonuclease n=1 Tax=Streptomyces sp. NPDC048436 TaxID=3365550 RepID=UPI00371BCDC2